MATPEPPATAAPRSSVDVAPPAPSAPPAPTAVQRVHAFVRERVFSGEYADGTMLSEGQIAVALGVSRTPVREAFVQLETQGFLRLYPKRGALVVPVSRDAVDEVLETRLVVERHGIELAIERSDASVFAAMRAACDQQRVHLDAGELDAFSDTDREFHRAAVAGTGNSILITLYDSLRDRQRRMVRGMVGGDPVRAASVLDEHLAILAAVEVGKTAKALRLLDAHLEGSRAALAVR